MNWYLIPIYKDETGIDPQYVPGVGSPGSVTEAPAFGSFCVQAHDPVADPTTALLGTALTLSPVPSGWTAMTLQEAQDHFELIMGREAAVDEVY